MHGGATGTQHLLLAETLGLAMARRASEILERHRPALAGDSAAVGGTVAEDDDERFAVDNAIFTAVLDAANECLGRFDTRPADDRWCDALLQVIHLAQLARLSAEGLPAPRSRRSRCRQVAATRLSPSAWRKLTGRLNSSSGAVHRGDPAALRWSPRRPFRRKCHDIEVGRIIITKAF